MNTIRNNQALSSRPLLLAVLFAGLAALMYLLIAWGFHGIGNLEMETDGSVIIFIAAGGYLFGGLLILARKRWLWMIGAIINALVIIFFVNMYHDRPGIMFSLGGITTKIPQLLLEGLLVYLIFSNWMRSKPE